MGQKIMIAAITALLIAGCRTDHSTEQAGKLEYRPAVNEVSVITLEKRPFSLQILSNGKLSAIAGSSLSFAGSGTIAKVNFCNGDRVKKGDVIAELENTDKRMALESASISLKKAELDYLDVLAGLGYSQPESAPEDVRELSLIRSGLSASRNEYEKARFALEGTCLKAPFSGVVANIKLKEWDSTDGNPFCNVIDDSRFEVKFNILESEYPIVSKGQSVRVTPFGKDAAISYSGKIKNVNPSIDENGQIEVCAVLDGASSLINGMNVKVTVDKVLDSRLVVPKSAVVVRDNLNVLFRYNNGRADWVYVNILAANSDSYAIEANAARGAELSVGEQIIVSGNLNLADGSAVSLKQ